MKTRARKKRSNLTLKKYQPIIENAFQQIVQTMENFNPVEYRTQQEMIKSGLEQQFTSNNDELVHGLLDIITTADLSSLARDAKKQLKAEINYKSKADVRFSELLKLVNMAEASYPNIGFIVFFSLNPLEDFAKAMEPYDLIQEHKSLKGERAARSAIRIFREVAELLYSDYLNIVFQFVQIAEGQTAIKQKGKFGVLADQLPGRLKALSFNPLVDPDAGWIRNATCHGHWTYDVQRNMLKLWDQKRPEKEFTPEQLFEKAMSMYQMVLDNYLPLLFIYLKEKIFVKWISSLKYAQAYFTALANGDKKTTEFIEKAMLAEFLPITKKLEFKK